MLKKVNSCDTFVKTERESHYKVNLNAKFALKVPKQPSSFVFRCNLCFYFGTFIKSRCQICLKRQIKFEVYFKF